MLDVASPRSEEERRVASEVLAELGVPPERILLVFNKSDRGTLGPRAELRVSALTGEGIRNLERAIGRRLRPADEELLFRIPYADGRAIAAVRAKCRVLSEEDAGDALLLRAAGDEADARLRAAIPRRREASLPSARGFRLVNRVAGKVAIVTGGALGIGRAACELLAREGAKVAVADVLDGPGAELAGRLADSGAAARYWRVDVAREEEVERVFGEIEAAFGRIDVLVNNAGISGASKPTHELTEEEWDRVQAVNVKGVFFCTKHAIPRMIAGGGGSIVNLSSIYGLVGAPDAPPYHASKGAVRLMTKTDALLYAKQGVRVNSVHPGFVWTPMVEAFIGSEPNAQELRRGIEALHPLGRLGRPEEIASGILFLASDESSFVTGSELVIDGGYTAR